MPNVLVIEDQKPVRDSIGKILEFIDCKCRLVGDGQVALNILLKDKFDLVTLDLNMPSLDGLSLTESLSIQENPNTETPIIVISAYLSNNARSNLQQLGIEHSLPKPFEAQDLLKLVRSILDIKE